MAGVTGRETNIAFAKFVTNSWNVAASVVYGAYFSSDGGMRLQPTYVEDPRMNQTFLGSAEVGDFAANDVTFAGQCRYSDNHYKLEALLFGSPAAVAISTSASGQTTSWSHVIDLASNIDGLGVTVAIDKTLFVDEMTSAKVYGMQVTYGEGGVVNQSFRLKGTTTTQSSAINSRSTVNGASYPSPNDRIFRYQGTFRINAQAAGALGASDEVKIEQFTFDVARPQDAPFVTNLQTIFEPADNGFPTLAFNVTFPRMNTVSANSLYQYLKVGSALKADLKYLGAYINSTDQRQLLYQFPYIEVQEWSAPLAGPSQVKPTAKFVAKKAVTSPTGMSFINPVRITRIMQNSINAFS